MIRAFPYGFNYPLPRTWPCEMDGGCPPRLGPWDSIQAKTLWRGFCIVMQQLAQTQHQVSELLIDASYLPTGLSYRIFDAPCIEYNNLVTLLQSPGFRRLDLDLLVGGQRRESWPSFRTGLIHRALAQATALEHVSLRADMVPHVVGVQIDPAQLDEHHIPLKSILPTDKWAHLQHFGILGLLVKKDDVIAILAALPATLRSVELSFLSFLGDDSSYNALLEDMRDKLGWQDR